MGYGWSCDFETTVEEPTRVWVWGAVDIDNIDRFAHGNSIEDFIIWASTKPKLFFHNEKFDGTFILDWLLKHGFNQVKRAKQKPPHQTFEMLMSKEGQLYEIKIHFSEDCTTTICDSYKKFRLSVQDTAMAFGMDIAKGTIDYTKRRPVGYEPTQDELSYLRTDCTIVAKALLVQFSRGLKKLTIGSDALTHYKELTPNFNNLFPQISLELYQELKGAYRGGWTYSDERFRYPSNDCGEGFTLDVNSLYPSVMYNCLMPYGRPVYFEGEYTRDKHYPIYIARIRVDAKAKPNHVRTLQIKGSSRFVETEYLRDTGGLVELTLTNIDIEIMFEQYDILEIQYLYGYKFRASDSLFRKYIDYWMEIKINSTGGARTLAKLMLNNLYGKFGKNPDTTGRVAILDGNRVRFAMGEQEYSEPSYIPVAAFVCSHARAKTIRAAQALYPWFAYADTDSLHLTGCSLSDIIKVLEIHDSKLGAWALESTWTKARFLHAKCYIEQVGEELEVTCAGMPDSMKLQVTWENFLPGSTFKSKLVEQGGPETMLHAKLFDRLTRDGSSSVVSQKLLQTIVEGGVLLKPTHFSLKASKLEVLSELQIPY